VGDRDRLDVTQPDPGAAQLRRKIAPSARIEQQRVAPAATFET